MAPKSIQNDSESKGVRKDNIYQEFITWYSIPPIQRFKTGIEDQNKFAEHYHISKDTLSLWKKKPDFDEKVKKIRYDWGRERTSDIFDAICRSAIKGNAESQKLWMTYFWEKPKENTGYIMAENDIRYMISFLPEPLQEKYTIFLRDLLHDTRLAFSDDKAQLDYKVKIYNEEKKILEKESEKRGPDPLGRDL